MAGYFKCSFQYITPEGVMAEQSFPITAEMGQYLLEMNEADVAEDDTYDLFAAYFAMLVRSVESYEGPMLQSAVEPDEFDGIDLSSLED